MGITFDRVNRYIKPDTTSVTVQQLINAIRDFEDEQSSMDIPQIAAASGKDSLGGGLTTGITLRLYDWRVKFPDQEDWILCTVTGGNIVAEDANGDPMDPVAPSEYVNASWEKAVSAVLLDDIRLDTIGLTAKLIEKIIRNKAITNPTDGKLTIFDDDNETVLLEALLYENAGGTQKYRGSGADRRERLV